MSSADLLDVVPQALRDAVMCPARRDHDIVVDGADVQVRFDPEPGVDSRIHAVEGDEELTVTVFSGAAERPASYPAELPYLAGHKASVRLSADGPAAGGSVTWWSVPDPESALADLRAQGAAAGWVEDPAGAGPPGMRMIDFRHPDGRHRLVHAAAFGAQTMISLTDTILRE